MYILSIIYKAPHMDHFVHPSVYLSIFQALLLLAPLAFLVNLVLDHFINILCHMQYMSLSTVVSKLLFFLPLLYFSVYLHALKALQAMWSWNLSLSFFKNK